MFLKKSRVHPDFAAKKPDKHHEEKVLAKLFEKNKSKESTENTSEEYHPEALKNQKSEVIPENSSPVCFAKSDEVRDEYKTE